MQINPTTSTRPYNLCTLPFPGNDTDKITEGSQPGDGFKSFLGDSCYCADLELYKKALAGHPLTEFGASDKDHGTILTYITRAANEPEEFIEYVTKLAGKAILDTGDCYGCTPLLTALKNSTPEEKKYRRGTIYGRKYVNHKERAFGIVKTLLQLDANPNIASNKELETPLYIAANLGISKITGLLLLYGAIAHPALTESGSLHIAQVKTKLFKVTKVKELFRAIFDNNSHFQLIPHDVTKQIMIKGIELLKKNPVQKKGEVTDLSIVRKQYLGPMTCEIKNDLLSVDPFRFDYYTPMNIAIAKICAMPHPNDQLELSEVLSYLIPALNYYKEELHDREDTQKQLKELENRRLIWISKQNRCHADIKRDNDITFYQLVVLRFQELAPADGFISYLNTMDYLKAAESCDYLFNEMSLSIIKKRKLLKEYSQRYDALRQKYHPVGK